MLRARGALPIEKNCTERHKQSRVACLSLAVAFAHTVFGSAATMYVLMNNATGERRDKSLTIQAIVGTDAQPPENDTNALCVKKKNQYRIDNMQ